jgi:hypothetical protein
MLDVDSCGHPVFVIQRLLRLDEAARLLDGDGCDLLEEREGWIITERRFLQ